MTQVYVIGDSHVEALAAGSALRLEDDLSAADVSVKFGSLGSAELLQRPFFEKRADTIHFTFDQMADALAELTGQNTIAKRPDTIFGFCMGFQSESVYRQPIWRQFAPWRVAMDARLPALSDAGCALAFARNNAFVFAFLDAVHDLGTEFFVIPAPPPRRCHHALNLGTKPAVLREVNRLHRQWMAGELDRRGYPYLPLPDAVTDDGFLKADYESTQPDDDINANALYGALVADQIQDFMAKREAAATPAPAHATVVLLRGVRSNSQASTVLA